MHQFVHVGPEEIRLTMRRKEERDVPPENGLLAEELSFAGHFVILSTFPARRRQVGLSLQPAKP